MALALKPGPFVDNVYFDRQLPFMNLSCERLAIYEWRKWKNFVPGSAWTSNLLIERLKNHPRKQTSGLGSLDHLDIRDMPPWVLHAHIFLTKPCKQTSFPLAKCSTNLIPTWLNIASTIAITGTQQMIVKLGKIKSRNWYGLVTLWGSSKERVMSHYFPPFH